MSENHWRRLVEDVSVRVDVGTRGSSFLSSGVPSYLGKHVTERVCCCIISIFPPETGRQTPDRSIDHTSMYLPIADSNGHPLAPTVEDEEDDDCIDYRLCVVS